MAKDVPEHPSAARLAGLTADGLTLSDKVVASWR